MSAVDSSETVPPEGLAWVRVTTREYWVVHPATRGVSFTVNVNARDARESAARWARPGTVIELVEHEHWETTSRLVGREVVQVPCGRDAGRRPAWMSLDQYDPCPCVLVAGHEPPCACEHIVAEHAPTSTSPSGGES